MKEFIKKHNFAAFLILSFGWTWLIVFYLIFSGNAEDINNPSLFFIIGGIISGFSPTVSAIIISAINGGKQAVKDLLKGFTKKSAFKWTLAALLIVPAVTALTTLISHYFIRSYEVKIVIPMIIMGLVWPIFSSTGEEFGWRGFILPKLLQKHSTLKAATIIGLYWAAWHIPMYYIGFKAYGNLMIPAILLIGFVNLTIHAIIMANIFVRTNGNIRLMVFYHYTLTGSSIIVGALLKTTSTPQNSLIENLVFVAIFAILAVALSIKKETKI